MHSTTEILANNLGQTLSAITHRYNTRNKVVHGTHKNASNRNPQKGNRAIASTHHSTENWARASNVK